MQASYWKAKEKMEFLWGADLKLNTVHVFDVARAIYFAAKKIEAGSTFNLADKADTDQGKLNGFLGAIFGIETGFHGSVVSNLARFSMDSLVKDANENHLGPWLALLKEYKIANTPLSPYLDKQLLQNNSLCIDGSAIETAGFKYALPELTQEALQDSIALHISQGTFPVSGGGRGGKGGEGEKGGEQCKGRLLRL